MRKIFAIAAAALVLAAAVSAQKKVEIVPQKGYLAPKFENSTELKNVINEAVEKGVAAVAADKREKLKVAVTVIDLTDRNKMLHADLAGENALYPASVVKMFYLAALERQLEDSKVTATKELERGMSDMIVDSSNEATQYILDVLTDTASGAEKPEKEFRAWQFKRDRVNRWLTAMGYTGINANQKTFCEDAYGIEQQSRAYRGENRNMLTTNATARMLAEIVLGNLNTPARTAAMMKLLQRDPFAAKPNEQSANFVGRALIDRKMTDAKLWSKAGWTSRSRHDAAYVELPNGRKFVIAIYTENNANDQALIANIAGRIIDEMSAK